MNKLRYVYMFIFSAGLTFLFVFLGSNIAQEKSLFQENRTKFDQIQAAVDATTYEATNNNLSKLNDDVSASETKVSDYIKANTPSYSGGGNGKNNGGGGSGDGNGDSDSNGGGSGSDSGDKPQEPEPEIKNNIDNILNQAKSKISKFMTYEPSGMGYYTSSYAVGQYTDSYIINDLVGKMKFEHDSYGNTHFRIEYIGIQESFGVKKHVFKCHRG